MNKLTKLLSVFIIAGAVGASVAGVAGCKKGGGGHSHSIDQWQNNLDGTHDGICSADGTVIVDDELHVFENGECVKCHAPEGEVLPAGVTFDTTTSESSVGREFTIVATISNAAALTDNLKVLTWEVENPTVASITISDDTTTVTVKCLTIGNTKITAKTVNGHTATYNLVVSNQATGVKITDASGKPIDRIALTPTSGDVTLKAEIEPAGSTDKEIEWVSSNPAVATVTADANDSTRAVVHMVAQGDAPILITAKVKGKSIETKIFCTADTYYGTLVNDTENLIINENFSAYKTGEVLTEWSGKWGTAGVYGSCTQKVATDSYGEGNQVKIATEENNNNNNRAELIDTTGSGTVLVVDYGAVDGLVKGYANIKMLEYGTSWTFMQIHGKDTAVNGGEILGLRADSSNLKVRVNGTAQDSLVTNIKPATGDTLRVYYEIDIKNDTAVIYINGTKFYEATAGTLGLTDLMGVKFVSSDNGSKTMSIDNIAVTHKGVTADEHKTDLLARLETEYAKYAEADYNPERWTTLTTAYNTAKTTITDATEKGVMDEAYDTAVAEMKKVPTKAGEELYAAKEALKEDLADTYPAGDYTYYATEYKSAYDAVVAAIDAYSGEVGDETAGTGLYGDAKISAAVVKLDAVKDDATVLSEAKTAAVAELEAHKGGASAFVTKATEYGEALQLHKGNINAVALPATGVTKEVVEAKLAEVTSALNAGKTAIDGIKTDAELLEDAKTTALEEIANYKLAEVNALAPSASMTQAAIDKAKADIETTRNLRSNAVRVATSIENVNAEVALAKTNIDSYLSALNETLAQVKDRELATLLEEYNKVKEGITDETVLKILKEDYDGYEGRINGIKDEADKSRVAEIRAEGVNLMRVRVARRTAYVDIAKYADEVKSDLHSESAKAAIDAEIKYDISTLTDQSKWSDNMWKIHLAATIVGVDAAKQVVINEIDRIAETAKNTIFTVELGETGETLKVKYGTELKLGDLFVTAKRVVSASYNGTEITAEAGVTVYDDIKITLTVADIDGFVPSDTWKLAADATAPTEGTVYESALFNIIAPAGTTYGAANAGFTNVAGEPNALQYIVPKATLGTDGKVETKGDNKANPFKIVVKSTLATLNINVLLSDSKARGSRTGNIYYSVDGGVTYKTASGTNAKIALTEVKAGTTVLIYADNASIKSSDGTAMDARLYLGKVEAAIDESKVAKEVSITWGTGSTAETYRYYDGVVLPETPVDPNGGAFIGWYYTPEGGTETKINEGDKFPSGTTIVATAKFATANVTVSYVVYGVTKDAKFYVADGETGIDWNIADPAPSEEDAAAGKVFLGWYTSATPAETDTPYDFTKVTAGTTQTVYAVFIKPAIRSSYLTCGATEFTSTNAAITNKTDSENLVVVDSGAIKYRNRGGTKTINDKTCYGWQCQSKTGDILTIKANETVTVTIYFNGYSDKGEDKSATLTYKPSATGEVKTASTTSAVTSFTMTIAKGETATISSDSGNKPAIWLIEITTA